MKLTLDYDPLNGIACELEFKQEGEKQVMVMSHKQDVTPILDIAKGLANDEDYTKAGVQKDQFHYARIPYVILQDMERKYGVKWEDKNDHKHKRFFRCLNAHYPAFKTTSWNHE